MWSSKFRKSSNEGSPIPSSSHTSTTSLDLLKFWLFLRPHSPLESFILSFLIVYTRGKSFQLPKRSEEIPAALLSPGASLQGTFKRNIHTACQDHIFVRHRWCELLIIVLDMSGQVTTSHRQGSQFSAGIASVVKPGCETAKGPEDKQPLHPSLPKHSCFHLWDVTGHAGLSRSIILPWGSVFTHFCCIKRMLLASQMIPAMLGGGTVNLSKLAGEDQSLPQGLAQLSAAPGSLCKLLLFP